MDDFLAFGETVQHVLELKAPLFVPYKAQPRPYSSFVIAYEHKKHFKICYYFAVF